MFLTSLIVAASVLINTPTVKYEVPTTQAEVDALLALLDPLVLPHRTCNQVEIFHPDWDYFWNPPWFPCPEGYSYSTALYNACSRPYWQDVIDINQEWHDASCNCHTTWVNNTEELLRCLALVELEAKLKFEERLAQFNVCLTQACVANP